LPLADRVLLVAVYRRTNLTMRQIGPLSGILHAAVHRVIDKVGPLLAVARCADVASTRLRLSTAPDRGEVAEVAEVGVATLPIVKDFWVLKILLASSVRVSISFG
jgi:DDE superfamily endonuclease